MRIRLRTQLPVCKKDGQQEEEKVNHKIVDHIKGIPGRRRKTGQDGKAADRLIAQIAGKIDQPEQQKGKKSAMPGIRQHGSGKQNGEKAAHNKLEPEQNGCIIWSSGIIC